MTKDEVIETFDPNGPGVNGSLFGLPFTPENAELIIVPVPWEVTVSYHTGTSKAPDAIRVASSQVDLGMKDIKDAWKLGICMLPVPQDMCDESLRMRQLSAKHILNLESGKNISGEDPVLIEPTHLTRGLFHHRMFQRDLPVACDGDLALTLHRHDGRGSYFRSQICLFLG